MADLGESYPFGAIRRQSKAQLAQPTASFEGETVVIIGATGVMCSEACKVLAQLRVDTLVFGVRNMAKAEALATEIVLQHGLERERIFIRQVDLTSFESTKAFVAGLQSLPRLDVLLIGSATNNTKRFVTGDGWEENLQVIHLACALLVVLLLPKLQKSAEEHHAPAVISNVSSSAVRVSAPWVKYPHPSRKEDPVGYLRDVSDGKVCWKVAQYGICKIVSYCWFETLSSLLDPSQIHVHSLDPGVTKSPLSTSSIIARLFLRIFGRSPVICGRAIANSCLPVENAHGAMLLDYEVEKYEPLKRTFNRGSLYRPTSFMTCERTQEMQNVIWAETRSVLEALSSDAKQVYANLDQRAGQVQSDHLEDSKA
ncbi:NAD(P)-binding protein [Apiospora kogelbergensis]|uniref:NAD(P)-binding protein n=1 Tax=Apiospora kogelbergensis TaxID=1337665 RepID=UPI00313198FB